MLGAGNIGRGFLGQLFSESGYEVVFVEVDEPLIDALNARGGYTIRLLTNERTGEVFISPVRAIHSRDTEAVAEALARASIAGMAVGVRSLPQIAPLVTAGVARRAERGDSSPVNILVCENVTDAAATFRKMVSQEVPQAHRAYFEANVGFVDTVIARMVPPSTPEMRAEDPSLIAVEPYKELPVDRSGFVGPVPDIVGMEARENFELYAARKLYIHNAGHAVLGYLGYLRGYRLGYEALEDETIRSILEQALAESKAGIVHRYGANAAQLEAHIADILRRFANRPLSDTIFRLARDPLRKLRPDDRLVGAARLAEKPGVTPEALSWGIAAGYCFDHPEDPLATRLQKRLADEGFASVLASVSDIWAGEPLGELVRQRYDRLRDNAWP